MAADSNHLSRLKEKVFQAVLDGVRWLTEPSAKAEPKQHRRIRLLSAFMLIMGVNTLLGSLYMRRIGGDMWKVMLATAIAFALGYFISRTRHYRIALGIAITTPAIPSIAFGIMRPPETGNTTELMWMALPLLVASLILTVRQTILVAVIYLIIITALGINGAIEFSTMAQVLAYISIITFFVITITYIRRIDQAQLENQLSERLKIEKTLRESEEKFRALFENAKDAIILADAHTGILLDINPAGCKLVGLPKEKIVGRHQSELHPPELAEKYKKTFLDHVEQGLVISDDTIIQNADGSHILCELSASVIKMGDGEVIQGVFRDITERRRMEKALAKEATRRRILVEQSRDGIVILDQDGKVYETNRRFAEMLGYSQEETMKLNVWDWEYLYPPEQVKEMLQTVTEEGDHFETRHRRKDGTTYDVEISTNGATFGGQKLIFCVCRDITERKQAEEALQESEESYRSLIENASIGIIVIQDGKRVLFNPQIPEMLGYTKEEYSKIDFLTTVHPEDRAMASERIKQRLQGIPGSPSPTEIRALNKAGEVRWLETRSVRIQWNGRPAVQVFILDNTERKQAEETLADEATRRRILVEQSRDGIVVLDQDGKVYETNRRFAEMLGYTQEEVLKLDVWDWEYLYPPEQVKEMIQSVTEEGDHFETKHRRKDGSTYDVEISTNGATFGGQKLIFCVCRDITERKQAEEAISEREKRFSDIAKNAEEWIWEVDAKGKYTYSSPVVKKILGYKPEEMLRKHFYDCFLPEEREELKKAAFAAFKQKQTIKEFINKNRCKNGKTVELITSGVPVLDEKENLIGYRGVDTDITEKRRSEQALKESEAKFSAAFRSSPNTMAITRIKDGKFIEVNDSHTRITGYTREETIGHTSTELDLWIDKGDRDRMLETLKKNGRVVLEEYPFRMKNGEIRTWLFSAEKIKIGDEPCIISITVDITERERTEQLQLDENYVLTLLGQGAELNEILYAIVRLGESHNPAIKGSAMLYDPQKQLLFPAATPSLPDSYIKLMENGLPIGQDLGACGTAAYRKEIVVVPDIRKSTLFPEIAINTGVENGLFACWSQPIVDSDGEILGTIANYSNKTGEPDARDLAVLEWSSSIAAIAIERKRAEQALRESEEKFSVAFHFSPQQIIITKTKDGITLDVNDSFTKNTGFTREETIGHSPQELNIWPNPEDRERFLRLLKKQGRILNEEFVFRKKSGEKHTVLLSAEHVVIGGEECLISILTDITERKKYEETLRFSDAAFKSIHESVIVTNLQGEITLWNDISEQLFGMKASEVIGKKFLQVIDVVETYPGEAKDRIEKIKSQGHWEEERLYRTKKRDVWVDVHLHDIVGNGKRYGRVMLASDITQRKRAEEELKQALAELEESSARLAATNKELEAFSYSVSHDLRSPLRSIDGFSQALLEDYEDKLDDTGQDYLKRLRGASQKMGDLIDGLLKLSRLTRSDMRHEKVDLSGMAEEITKRLQETHPKRRAKFIIQKGLTTEGDPQLLRALLENLLSNAWKFTRFKSVAKIEFSLEHNGDKNAYFIRDNGAGFDMAYSDKLFGAFQRLHDNNEYPGTGIGLATVQRIIHRHGGTIRAEGKVGKGATFYFTLN